MAESAAVPRDGAKPYGCVRRGKQELKGDDFSRFQFPGQRRPQSIITNFGRPSPKRERISQAEHLHRDPHVERVAWEAPLPSLRRIACSRSRHDCPL